ncbi:LacI family DNA-binding transcriptional regulator [Clostridiales bacterium COT073_COT-073]|nr:LacI family DNA-binding transcriptional regulator [Clostridiales bacterium COT073_COT-073]
MTGSKKVTLKDIANASGYSLVSVHRAMNNKEGVSSQVKQRILKVAAELGYTANYVASALKRRQVNVAVVLPESEKSGKYYFRYIWKGCEAAIEEVEGYNINTIRYVFSARKTKGSQEQIEILKNLYQNWGEKLDGLLTTPDSDNPQIQCLLSQFSGKGVSVVLIDNDFENCGRLCCIAPNNIYTGRLAAELMNLVLKKSKGTILVAQGDERSLSHKMNVEGFSQYFSEVNANIKIKCVKDFDDAEKNRKELLKCLHEDHSIIAAYTARARITIPLCQAVIDSGRKEDIFTVGSDLFPESAQMLRDGILKAIVYKNPYEKGYLGYLTLFEYLIKGKAPKGDAISVNISIILQNNIRFFEEYI